MTDIRKKLSEKFQSNNLYPNFGPIIKTMTINGFRGIMMMKEILLVFAISFIGEKENIV